MHHKNWEALQHDEMRHMFSILNEVKEVDELSPDQMETLLDKILENIVAVKNKGAGCDFFAESSMRRPIWRKIR